MLKEFIEHIQQTTQPIIHETAYAAYAVTANGESKKIADFDCPLEPINLTSLDALVKLVQTEAVISEPNRPLFITIPDHLTVQCFSRFDVEDHNRRQTYYIAKATDVPGWESKVQLPFEEAQIALRTRFQDTPDTQYAMRLLTEISTGARITYNDNGVATTVVTKKGIDLQANEAIRPIITLKPYRTFQEVEQPDSMFLIRINERGISFIEADGGMWKLHAREIVKKYLEERLASEIEHGNVVVAL